jgi:hypothetical protein
LQQLGKLKMVLELEGFWGGVLAILVGLVRDCNAPKISGRSQIALNELIRLSALFFAHTLHLEHVQPAAPSAMSPSGGMSPSLDVLIS